MGNEDNTDTSEDYHQFDEIRLFAMNVDPSIQLANEEAPYLRGDHNQGTIVKKKFITILDYGDL